MDGWHVLDLLAQVDGARFTLFLAGFTVAFSPRMFGVLTMIVVVIHVLVKG